MLIGKRAIESKWLYKVNFKPNGEVHRFKARLVAKGYSQLQGIDYHESCSPISKNVIIRLLLAIAAARDWHVH